MTIQLSTAARNGRLDAIETEAGTSAKLMIYTGSQPAACANVATGTLLVEFDLASDWAAAASGGSKSFNNTPISATAANTGSAAHFRLYKSNGTTCVMQGTVTATGGGGDATIDNASIQTGHTIIISSFSVTDGNP